MFSSNSFEKSCSVMRENLSPGRNNHVNRFPSGITSVADENQLIRIQLAVHKYNNSSDGLAESRRNFISPIRHNFLRNPHKKCYEGISDQIKNEKKIENRYEGVGNFPTVHLRKSSVRYRPIRKFKNDVKVPHPEFPISRFLNNLPELCPDFKSNTRSVLDVLQDMSRKGIQSKDEGTYGKFKSSGLGGDLILDGEVVSKPLFVQKPHASIVVTKDSTTQTILPQHVNPSNYHQIVSSSNLNTQPVVADPRAELRKKLAKQNNEIYASLSSSISSYCLKRKIDNISTAEGITKSEVLAAKKAKMIEKQQGIINESGIYRSTNSTKSYSHDPIKLSKKNKEGGVTSPNKDRLTTIFLEMGNSSPKAEIFQTFHGTNKSTNSQKPDAAFFKESNDNNFCKNSLSGNDNGISAKNNSIKFEASMLNDKVASLPADANSVSASSDKKDKEELSPTMFNTSLKKLEDKNSDNNTKQGNSAPQFSYGSSTNFGNAANVTLLINEDAKPKRSVEPASSNLKEGNVIFSNSSTPNGFTSEKDNKSTEPIINLRTTNEKEKNTFFDSLKARSNENEIHSQTGTDINSHNGINFDHSVSNTQNATPKFNFGFNNGFTSTSITNATIATSFNDSDKLKTSSICDSNIKQQEAYKLQPILSGQEHKEKNSEKSGEDKKFSFGTKSVSKNDSLQINNIFGSGSVTEILPDKNNTNVVEKVSSSSFIFGSPKIDQAIDRTNDNSAKSNDVKASDVKKTEEKDNANKDFFTASKIPSPSITFENNVASGDFKMNNNILTNVNSSTHTLTSVSVNQDLTSVSTSRPTSTCSDSLLSKSQPSTTFAFEQKPAAVTEQTNLFKFGSAPQDSVQNNSSIFGSKVNNVSFGQNLLKSENQSIINKSAVSSDNSQASNSMSDSKMLTCEPSQNLDAKSLNIMPGKQAEATPSTNSVFSQGSSSFSAKQTFFGSSTATTAGNGFESSDAKTETKFGAPTFQNTSGFGAASSIQSNSPFQSLVSSANGNFRSPFIGTNNSMPGAPTFTNPLTQIPSKFALSQPTSTFGGSTTTQAASSFGGSVGSQATPTFGASVATPATSTFGGSITTQSSTGFGMPSTSQTSSFGQIFGQSSKPVTTTSQMSSVFGQNNVEQTSMGTGFASTTNTSFGSPVSQNIFGQETNNDKNNIFGKTQTSSSFGSTFTTGFGSQNNFSFGSSSSNNTGFTTTTPKTTAPSIFTFGSNSNNPTASFGSGSISGTSTANSTNSATSPFVFNSTGNGAFKFGTSTAKETPSFSGGGSAFSFSGQMNNNNNGANNNNSTGGGSANNALDSKPAFNFGNTQTPSGSTFNFGSSSSPSVFSFGGSGSSTASSSGFNFGASQPVTPFGQANSSPVVSFSAPGTFSIGSGSTQSRPRASSRLRRRP